VTLSKIFCARLRRGRNTSISNPVSVTLGAFARYFVSSRARFETRLKRLCARGAPTLPTTTRRAARAAVAFLLRRALSPDLPFGTCVGRLARTVVPNPLPAEPFISVCVPKAPPRPPATEGAAPKPHSPVRLHPTTILTGILEVAHRVGQRDEALAAVASVSISPSKLKAAPKRKRPLPSLNPQLQAAAAAGSAALAAESD
jgi:hypothetical protein